MSRPLTPRLGRFTERLVQGLSLPVLGGSLLLSVWSFAALLQPAQALPLPAPLPPLRALDAAPLHAPQLAPAANDNPTRNPDEPAAN